MILVATAPQLGLDQGERLVVTRFNHFSGAWRDSSRGGRSPHAGHLDGFPDRPVWLGAQAYRILISSAYWVGVRNAIAMYW